MVRRKQEVPKPTLEYHLQKFNEARESISEFEAKHEQLLAVYRDHATEFNARLEQLKGSLREAVKASGEKRMELEGFTATRIFEKQWDPDVLCAHTPLAELEKSGAVEMVTSINVNEDKLLTLVALGKLPTEVMKSACQELEKTTRVNAPYKDYRF